MLLDPLPCHKLSHLPVPLPSRVTYFMEAPNWAENALALSSQVVAVIG